jgi:hypothetical protein
MEALVEICGDNPFDWFISIITLSDIVTDYLYFANIVHNDKVHDGLKAGVFIFATLGTMIGYDALIPKKEEEDIISIKYFGLPFLEDVPQLFLLVCIERQLDRFNTIAYISFYIAIFSATVRLLVYIVYLLKKQNGDEIILGGLIEKLSFWLGYGMIFLSPVLFLLLYFFRVI